MNLSTQMLLTWLSEWPTMVDTLTSFDRNMSYGMVQCLTDSTIHISFKGSFIHNASDTAPYYEAPFISLLFNTIICI